MASPSDALMRAIKAVENRYSPADWQQIPPRLRTAAIYQELRRLDAERVGAAPVGRFERPRPRRRAPGKSPAAAAGQVLCE